jgi:transposase InsO family protein
VQHAQQLRPERELAALLAELGLPCATYYRWTERQGTDDLADRIVTPKREAIPPTPAEAATVRDFATHQPLLGYQRLTYALMAENKAFVREWMVRDILSAAELLGRRTPPAPLLRRPPEPDHPDPRGHTDLMLWHFNGRWFYRIDVLDAYSRYRVPYELLLTAGDAAVILAMQRARETLAERVRLPGEPQIVHDNGPQFISHEWKQYIQASQMQNVRTPPYHPQSNGRDERLHRTLREELPLTEEATLYEARALLADYRTYYNQRRPHSALHYLCPLDYYRGDPAARLAEREANLRRAADERRAYWEQHRPSKPAETIS